MNKASYICLHRLHIYAYHGVYEAERIHGNDFLLDLRLKVDVTRAMTTDRVADTVDYAAVCSLVKHEMSIPSNLLEHVAGRIAEKLLSAFPAIEEVELKLSKCHPPMMETEVEQAAVMVCHSR
ncbi:MAG: dihydroneopterin aldolase [Prevotellaceae bacterium]|jgi:dihydroneopterin aldolase|nr:dihydroneopterin aldolase [Prevotellaceae bacterium]